MTPRHLLSVLAVAVLLTACGGEGQDDGAPASASSAPAERSGEVAGSGAVGDDGDQDAPPFREDTGPATRDASDDALLSVTDIRVGRQDGFDRVVFEVSDTGTPGWDVRYVESASSQGSGTEVDVAGGAVLQVTITGTGYPHDTGAEEFSGAEPLVAPGTEAVTEVVWDHTFEGTSVAFVGTVEPRPFRVYLLEAPARIVLEVAHPR
jgi:hypothetical protein